MAFRVPTFNLDVHLWRFPNVVSAPPDVTFKANLSRGDRIFFAVTYFTSAIDSANSQMVLLCPAGTDVRPQYMGTFDHPSGHYLSDLVEVPAGSGRYYLVIEVDDTAKGFPNEYRHAVLWSFTPDASVDTGNPWEAPPWPLPIP